MAAAPIIFAKGTAPAAPPAGKVALYVDTSGVPHYVDETGADSALIDPTAASAAAASASASETAAAASASAAASSQVAAEAAADVAQLSAGVYADTTVGLAATTSGQYFSVPSADSAEYLILYKNNAGSAVEVKRYPSADRVSGLEGDVSAIDALLVDVTRDNLYNPDRADSEIDKYYHQTDGSIQALAKYATSGLVPVVAGQTYTIDIRGAAADWDIYNTGMMYYTGSPASTGTFQQRTTTNVTYSAGNRTVTFTVPTGATYVGWIIRDLIGAAPTGADLVALRNATMMNVGSAALPFAPYVAVGARDFPDTVKNPAGPVTAIRSGTDLYIRQRDWKRPDKDSIRKISVGVTPSATVAGTVDFTGQRFADSRYGADQTIVAYNAGDSVWSSTDNGPPVKFNNAYLGGGHGLAAAYYLTIAGHGLTNADVGDVGTISAKSWVLAGIIDANTILVVAANTGASTTKWTISGSISGSGTITFASAGAKAYTASVSKQVWPLVQNLVQEILLDDNTEITADGTYNGQSVTVRERYGIPNPAAWLATLISEKGTATPKALNDPAIQTQVQIDQSWRFDRYGAMVGYNGTRAVQEFVLNLTGSFDYIGAWLHQTILKSGHTLHQYVPDLAGAVGGYDFKAVADITANAATVVVATTDSADPANPPSHFAQLVKLAGAPVHGVGFGYIRTKGAGVPATRAANAKVWMLSTSEKQYPVAWDGARFPSNVVPAGTVMQTAFWDAAYSMTDTPTHTIDVVYEDAGKVYRVIDMHATVSYYAVPMPNELVGKKITVIDKSSSLTLHTDAFVPGGGIVVSVTGGWGRAVLEIG